MHVKLAELKKQLKNKHLEDGTKVGRDVETVLAAIKAFRNIHTQYGPGAYGKDELLTTATEAATTIEDLSERVKLLSNDQGFRDVYDRMVIAEKQVKELEKELNGWRISHGGTPV